MKNFLKAIAISLFGMSALGFTAANADRGDRRDHRPDFCDVDHDHRSHSANYYNHYDHDRYYRAGPYRNSGVSLSIRVGDRYDRYDRRHDRRSDRRYDRRYDNRGRRHGYRDDRGRVVNREVFDTRYRARIVLTEEVIRTRRGPQLVCTVRARGPQARYVKERRMYNIAHRNCSRRAQVRVVA